jgi:glycosyltransferase involved in cell wall biosynthesis
MRRQLETALLRLGDYFRINNYSALAALSMAPIALVSPNRRSRMNAAITFATYHAGSTLGSFLLSRAKDLAQQIATETARNDEATISRSAVIKPFVSKAEPGLLLVSFEYELSKLVALSRFTALELEYRIIFLPTWQPFYSDAVCLLDARATQSYFLMPSAFTEDVLCRQFSSKCRYLPFHAASWVRHASYQRPCSSKDIDILMIANFARYKRHWRLFEALARMPAGLRIVIAGLPLGKRTKESLLHEARLFGVDERIEIIEGATDSCLRSLLRRSRIFCAMTYKEGSYIAVAEALMAGVPVAMFEGAQVGTKAYITPETGFLLSPKTSLARQLAVALEATRDLDTQEWAKKHISAEANCTKLNDRLARWAAEERLEWTRDIEPFYCQNFGFRYFDQAAEEAMAGEYKRMERQFGLTIRRPKG